MFSCVRAFGKRIIRLRISYNFLLSGHFVFRILYVLSVEQSAGCSEPNCTLSCPNMFSPFSAQRARRFPNATQTQAVKMWSRDVLRKEVQSYKEVILPCCFVKFNLKPDSKVNIPNLARRGFLIGYFSM